MFAEVPDVDDITIQYQLLRIYRFQIVEQFISMTPISAQMYITDDYYFQLSFGHKV